MKLNPVAAIAIGAAALHAYDAPLSPAPPTDPASQSALLPALDHFTPNNNAMMNPEILRSSQSGTMQLELVALGDGTYMARWVLPDPESRAHTVHRRPH